MKAYDNLQKNAVIDKRLNTLTDLVYKNNAEFGFVGLTGVVSTSLAMSRIDLIGEDKELKDRSNSEKAIKDYRNATNYEVGSIQEKTMVLLMEFFMI